MNPPDTSRRAFLKGITATAGAGTLIGVGANGVSGQQQPGPTVAAGNDREFRGGDLNYSTGLKREGLDGDPFIQSNSGGGSTVDGTPYPATSSLDNFRNRPGSQTGYARIGTQFEVTGNRESTATVSLQGTLPANHSNISIATEDRNYPWDGWPELPPLEPFTSGSVSLEVYAVVLDITDHGWNAEQIEIRRVGPLFGESEGGTDVNQVLPSGDEQVNTEFSMSFVPGRRYAITLELKSTVTVGGYDLDEHYAMVSGSLFALLDAVTVDWAGTPTQTTEQSGWNPTDLLRHWPWLLPWISIPPLLWYLRNRFYPGETGPPPDAQPPADPVQTRTDHIQDPCRM